MTRVGSLAVWSLAMRMFEREATGSCVLSDSQFSAALAREVSAPRDLSERIS